MKKPSSPFSPQKTSVKDDPIPMTYAYPQVQGDRRQPAGNSIWLSKKMIDEGCTLEQTLQVMEEQCKSCNMTSPVLCMGQCDTWKVKKELRETSRILSESNHGLRLLNALKNSRRLIILSDLTERPLTLDRLQENLTRQGYQHSQNTINGYLQPLVTAGLVEERDRLFALTLYGRRIQEAVLKHSFAGHLPIHSGGHEEKILESLLGGPKTRKELLEIAPAKSMSRSLKRLQASSLVLKNSPSDRVFYFHTKRPTTMERLLPTQRKIHAAIPQAGISARALSRTVGINPRRVYKCLRGLRGKKLVFRRDMPRCYELTERGRTMALFLREIAGIK